MPHALTCIEITKKELVLRSVANKPCGFPLRGGPMRHMRKDAEERGQAENGHETGSGQETPQAAL